MPILKGINLVEMLEYPVLDPRPVSRGKIVQVFQKGMTKNPEYKLTWCELSLILGQHPDRVWPNLWILFEAGILSVSKIGKLSLNEYILDMHTPKQWEKRFREIAVSTLEWFEFDMDFSDIPEAPKVEPLQSKPTPEQNKQTRLREMKQGMSERISHLKELLKSSPPEEASNSPDAPDDVKDAEIVEPDKGKPAEDPQQDLTDDQSSLPQEEPSGKDESSPEDPKPPEEKK